MSAWPTADKQDRRETPRMDRAVVLVSGGVNSAVVLAASREQYSTALLHISWGHRTADRKREAFLRHWPGSRRFRDPERDPEKDPALPSAPARLRPPWKPAGLPRHRPTRQASSPLPIRKPIICSTESSFRWEGSADHHLLHTFSANPNKGGTSITVPSSRITFPLKYPNI